MAFNNVGFNTVGPGGTLAWNFFIGDRGLQIMQPQPLTPDCELFVDGVSKSLRGSDGQYFYTVRVSNLGPTAASFRWNGGGVI